MKMVKVSEYRDHLRMAEILNSRVNYEDMLYENHIFVNKNLRHLSRDSLDNIKKYFSRNHKDVSNNILNLCDYYAELLSNENLDIV